MSLMNFRGHHFFLSLFYATLVLVAAAGIVGAQTLGNGLSTRTSDEAARPARPFELGSPEEEMRARNSIKLEEKRRADTLERVRDGATIAASLHQQCAGRFSLGRDELKQLEKFEKLVKKVRGDVGGDSDEQIELETQPANVQESLELLSSSAAKLRDEVERTSRHVVSAAVINRANELLVLAKTIRQQAQISTSN